MRQFILILLIVINHHSYAKESRYSIDFINKSSFYKKEAKILRRFFSEEYLFKKESHRIRLIAFDRMHSITKQNVKKMKILLSQNPLYLIMWPTDKGLIQKYLKKLEEEQRK